MSTLTDLLTVRRMLAMLLALAFAVIAVLLGNWQYSRHQGKVEARALIEQHYAAEPVLLSSVLGTADEPWEPALEWTRVEVTGHYRVDEQLLVRNRPHDGVSGYEVALPFVPDDSACEALLVARGWVRNAADAATLPEVPAVPEGSLTVTGWLRPGEVDLGRDPPAGQLASINLAEATRRSGSELYDAYLVLGEELVPGSVSAPERPVPADPPDTGLGPHFAYALQWWLTAPLGVVLVVLMARRDAQAARPGVPAHGIPSPARKPRIWDEEDE